MNKTVLATEIVDALAGGNTELTGAARTAAIAQWELIADKIITHLKLNAVITLDPSCAVTTGPGAGGAVVGTAKVTA